MKSAGPLLLAFLPTLLAAVTGANATTPVPPQLPPTSPQVIAPPAAPSTSTQVAPTKPASDYTSGATNPPLVEEYDPATAPPPMYAEPSDDDGIRQCQSPEGVTVFTDRRCADLGASPYTAPPAPMGEATNLPPRVRTCARNQGMLLDGVRAALESHDANRLADYYHWSGMDSKSGYALMDRLNAFSNRQVVDVRLVRNAAPADAPDLFDNRFDPLPPSTPDADPEATPEGASDAGAPRPPPRRALASLLRVDQMRGADDVSANVTYFHLLTNAGCWWMRF